MQDRATFLFRLFAATAASLIAATPALAAPSVVANLLQPPGGLACSQAAGQTKVEFDFKSARSDLKQISVFIDGKGVPERSIVEDWPRLTVTQGLHPGRNKVEVYATGKDDKTEAHQLTVLVGEAPSRNDGDDVAIVDCVGRTAQTSRDRDERRDDGKEVIAEANDDADEVVEDVRPHVDHEVDEGEDVVYEDAPVYVYRPYPVYGYVSFFPVYYYPWPYYYGYYGYPRYYGYYGYGGHGYRGGYPGYRHYGGVGGYWHGGSRAPQPTRPPTSSRGGGDRRRNY